MKRTINVRLSWANAPHRTCRRQYSTPQEPPPSYTQLKSKPWQNAQDLSPHDSLLSAMPLTRYNFRLADAVKRFKAADCFSIAAEMKTQSIKPNLETYNHLLAATVFERRHIEAWATLEDMILCGISPNVTSFTHIINAHASKSSSYLWGILSKMELCGVTPDAALYSLLVRRFAHDENLELCLFYLQKMREKTLNIEHTAMSDIVFLAAKRNLPQLAINLIEAYEAANIRKVEPEVWLACLTASANLVWSEGLTRCWATAVTQWQLSPDEGLCLRVLDAAARLGLTELAFEVLNFLQNAEISWKEEHIAPAIQAFCVSGGIEAALKVIGIASRAGIPLGPGTLTPVAHLIAAKGAIDIDETWQILDKIQTEDTLFTAQLNALLLACVQLKDLKRIVGAFNAFDGYDVEHNLDSFHIYFRGLIATKRRDVADAVLDLMKEQKISRTRDTYHLMIELCLTQASYEDAFHYLEEAKAVGHTPSRAIYKALIQTCASNADSRYAVAAEEMQEQGYKLRDADIRQMEDTFAMAEQEQLASADHDPALVLEANARQYIETGGVVSHN